MESGSKAIAYKVVAYNRDGREEFKSCVICGAWCLYYDIGKETRSRAGSGIFCFETEKQAFDFYEGPAFQVLEVEAEDRMEAPGKRPGLTRCDVADYTCEDSFADYWAGRVAGDSPTAEGTVFYGRVTPLHAVDRP